MKKLISLSLSLFLFSGVFAQVLTHLPEKKQSRMDIVFSALEQTENSQITIAQVVNLLDSLDQENVKKPNKEKNTFRVNEKGDTVYSVGDRAQGGIVFWVNEYGTHGLVSSPNDLTGGVT